MHFRILCNVSGSGKTRLLFKGLCQNWGFYFAARKGPDGIGSPDFAIAIDNMKNTPGWYRHVFKDNQAIQDAIETNEVIAKRDLSKLFLARWIIFYAFLEAAKKLNKGKLPQSIKHDWLLFQIKLPPLTSTPAPPLSALGYYSIPSYGPCRRLWVPGLLCCEP